MGSMIEEHEMTCPKRRKPASNAASSKEAQRFHRKKKVEKRKLLIAKQLFRNQLYKNQFLCWKKNLGGKSILRCLECPLTRLAGL